MGQQADNYGRNAALDQQKERAAGRMEDRNPQIEAIKDAQDPLPMKGATGGASGKADKIDPTTGIQTQGGGGGAGATAESGQGEADLKG